MVFVIVPLWPEEDEPGHLLLDGIEQPKHTETRVRSSYGRISAIVVIELAIPPTACVGVCMRLGVGGHQGPRSEAGRGVIRGRRVLHGKRRLAE